MKVAVISSTVFPCPPTGYAGLEYVAYQQAKGLAKLGHQVALFAPDGSVCPEAASVVHFGLAGQTDEKTAYSRYWQMLSQVEVVLDHSWQKWAAAGRQEGWLKAPVLAWCHAPVNTMFQALPPPGVLSFVCISEDQRSHFEALYNRPARTCYNGVDGDFYKPLGLPRSGRFLFLARFSAIKGAELAIRACLDAGVGLDLIGDTSITNEPDYLAHCKALARQTSPGWDASGGPQIRLVGPCTRGEAVWWYSQAHAMLHPVRDFREPFGLAPVEAQLCGCPVIAWDNGAMRETVGACGVLVQSYDDLVLWVKDWAASTAALAADGPLRGTCRQHALKFSNARMCRRVEELCEEALTKGPW